MSNVSDHACTTALQLCSTFLYVQTVIRWDFSHEGAFPTSYDCMSMHAHTVLLRKRGIGNPSALPASAKAGRVLQRRMPPAACFSPGRPRSTCRLYCRTAPRSPACTHHSHPAVPPKASTLNSCFTTQGLQVGPHIGLQIDLYVRLHIYILYRTHRPIRRTTHRPIRRTTHRITHRTTHRGTHRIADGPRTSHRTTHTTTHRSTHRTTHSPIRRTA